MSFGGFGGGGGFGQQNTTNTGGFGGFGANNNNTTSGMRISAFPSFFVITHCSFRFNIASLHRFTPESLCSLLVCTKLRLQASVTLNPHDDPDTQLLADMMSPQN